MPNTKNVASITLITEKFEKSKSVVLANYAGLNSKQQVALRQALKNAGGELLVAKNTLVARVIGKDELNQSFSGQTGTVFSYDDEVSALKALVAFAKENKGLQVKQGYVAGAVYSSEQIIELSKLPGKTELIQMLLSRLNAPASKLVGVLNAGVRDLAFVLARIAEKKQA